MKVQQLIANNEVPCIKVNSNYSLHSHEISSTRYFTAFIFVNFRKTSRE